ncbi:MAG: hypothetical protein IKC94_04190 [Lentisphaeria bacterium]|nr:hypothetical protein [Lentisphaeria bacterium]
MKKLKSPAGNFLFRQGLNLTCLVLYRAGRRNNNYADNNGNNNDGGNGYDNRTGDIKCRDKVVIAVKKSRIHFSVFFSVIPNRTIKKPLTGRSPLRGQTILFNFRSTTATSRTAADNYGDGNNNNADNVVEKSIHFFLVSFQNAF